MAEKIIDHHLGKEIDSHYILELVRRVSNDKELGAKVRSYVNLVTAEKI